jgi:hypothetical protein
MGHIAEGIGLKMRSFQFYIKDRRFNKSKVMKRVLHTL